MPKRPIFPSKQAAVLAGVAFFAAGWACLYDAYDGRGNEQPWFLRPFTWW